MRHQLSTPKSWACLLCVRSQNKILDQCWLQEIQALNVRYLISKGDIMAETKSVYEVLSKIDVKEKTEQKNGLTYLSWAWAWHMVKSNFPNATYIIYENKDGWNYHTDGKTAWVKTGVSVEGLEHIEYLPVMDFRNKSIPVEQLTSFDVNKAIQRSLTKAVARLGLGLSVFAGEDLPLDSGVQEVKPQQVAKTLVGDPNQKARPNTVEQLKLLEADLLPEQKAKVQNFLLKNGALKYEDLTEATARTLLLNIQGSMTSK